ncbi:hypothetical protein [Algibacter sp. L3A6]|uniref:hypothetical protein n=1 Tax=Algibacter sp. L3A6 TaxID=2686366 RepID=UPI00131C9B45|nr:hypothetical protein [Algibacter sp. L3A6]
MNEYYKNLELRNENEVLSYIVFILSALLLLVIIRNWYNLYKKRSFRKTIKKNKQQLQQQNKQLKNALKSLDNHNEDLKRLTFLKEELKSKYSRILYLKQDLEDFKSNFYSTLNKKDIEIAKQKEKSNHQKTAYERFVNYKNVEANNTRLGAHFIKNVISQIYDDMEQTDNSYKSFLGINYKMGANKNKIPPIKALKNIFKLLDYNVSALNKDNTSLEEELEHITMFLDLIKYLKPNTNIQFDNSLKQEQKENIKIKPTLFFPFVENALKHGSLNNTDSFISIVLKENQNKQLSYCLVNSAEQQLDYQTKAVESSNFGLNALQQLLTAYYPNSTLEHKTLPNNQYLSELTLSLN